MSIFSKIAQYSQIALLRWVSALILLALSMSCGVCMDAAASVRMRQFTASDGLSENTVRNIFQDSLGYLWLSTPNGLNRYDGYRFRQFTDWPGDLHVKDISIDGKGRMWIVTSANKYVCFDSKSGNFLNIDSQFADREFTRRHEARDGTTYLWHPQTGLLRLKDNGKEAFDCRFFNVLDGSDDPTVTSLSEDFSRNIWVSTTSGLRMIVSDKMKHIGKGISFASIITRNKLVYSIGNDGTIYRINTDKASLSMVNKCNGNVGNGENVYVGKDAVYISHTNGVSKFNLTDESLTDFPSLPGDSKFLIDNKGNGWIGDRKGAIMRIGRQDGSVARFDVMPGDLLDKVGYERYGVYEDIHGNRWVATYGNGVLGFSKDNNLIAHYSNSKTIDAPLPTNYVLSISGDRSGNIWIGTEHSGLIQLSQSDADFRYVYPAGEDLHDRSNSFRLVYAIPGGKILAGNRYAQLYSLDGGMNTIGKPQSFSKNVMTAVADRKGCLWLGLRGDGIHLEGTIGEYKADNSLLGMGYDIFDLIADKKNRIWAAMFDKGIGVVIPEGKAYRFREISGGKNGVTYWRDLEQDGNGYIWCATSRGLVIFHPDSLLSAGEMSLHHFDTASGLPGNEIRQILKTGDGRMWTIVLGEGIMAFEGAYDGKLPAFKVINSRDGLANNLVQSLVEDFNGNIWAATEKNLSRIEVLTGFIDSYSPGTSEGSNIFLENAATILEDGRLVFGTDYGLLTFDPSLIATGKVTPNPVLTDFSLIEGNGFEATLSTFGFSPEDATTFSYLLEGYDKEWSNPMKGGTIAYSNLPSGHYSLKVKARDKGASWSGEVVLKEFDVSRNWGWYARMILPIILVAVVVLAAIVIIRKRLKKRITSADSSETLTSAPNELLGDVNDGKDSFMENLKKIIASHLDDADYSIDDFAADMNMSRTTLYNVMKSRVSIAPMEYLRSCRLERGAELLLTGKYNVSEVAAKVGMRDPLYFSRSFKNRFGASPTAYVKTHNSDVDNDKT